MKNNKGFFISLRNCTNLKKLKTKNKLVISLLTGLLYYTGLAAQELPDFGPVFPQNEVSEIRIEIDPDSLSLILHPDSAYSNHEYPAKFIFISSNLNDTIENIGFRLRGNTSRTAEKKSFKVSFNTFEPGRKYYNLEKLNLNGNQNDVSQLRVKLFWDAYRFFNLPGSRTSFTKLFINNEYKGLYINVEHIDEQFIDAYFENNNGNLYKCLYPADLTYQGSDPEEYKVEVFGRRPYELKTNYLADDYADLANFIDVINNSSDDNFKCEIQDVFNIHHYIKYAALDILHGNWDGYIYNKNNYYLYHNLETDRFEYLPYDVDNTLGIDWLGVDWSDRNIYNWSNPNEENPLFERFIDNEDFRNEFSNVLAQYTSLWFDSGEMINRANYWHNLIADAVSNDLYYPLDFGFTYSDFQTSIDIAWGEHIGYSISDYVTIRSQYIENQLDDLSDMDYISEVLDNAPLSSSSTLIVQVQFVSTTNNVPELQYSYNQQDWLSSSLNDQGILPDEIANDGWYSAIVNADEQADRIYYRLHFANTGDYYPCDAALVWLSPAQAPLTINELQAANTTTILDEGQSDDWFELFCLSGAVNLSSIYASDDLNIPGKWDLPSITLDAGDFVLLWADSDENSGLLHAPFSLDATADELYLFQMQSGAMRILDHIQWQNLPTNYSIGRTFDGLLPWISFDSPTPGASNQSTAIEEINTSELIAFPNPSADGRFYFTESIVASVFDVAGRLVYQFSGNHIEQGILQSGLYYLKDQQGRSIKLVVKIA
jgi:hypothetical protein